MNAALAYLYRTQRRNACARVVSGLRDPKRLISTLVWTTPLVLFAVLQGNLGLATQPGNVRPMIAFFLAVLFLLSLLGGLMQRGLPFQASDIDFLFPAPFDRRQLVAYRVASLYPFAIMTGLVLAFLFFSGMQHRVIGTLGFMACQVVYLHLQTAVSVLSARLSERTFRTLHKPLQLGIFAMALLGFGLAPFLLGAEAGGRAMIENALNWEASRILFYPAFCAAELATATRLDTLLLSAVGLLSCAIGSLLFLQRVDQPYFEASLAATRNATRSAQAARRGLPAAATHDKVRARALKLPAARCFSGSGALVWKNILCLGRSVRLLVITTFFTMLFVLPSAFTAGAAPSTLPEAFPSPPLALLALLPLFLHNYVAFDLRRDLDNLVMLRTLPLHPTRLAAAQVTVPVLVILVFQFIGVLAAFSIGQAHVRQLWVPLLVYPAFTTLIVTAGNLGFLMAPVPNVSESGRLHPGVLATNMISSAFFFVLAVAPCVFAATLVLCLSGSGPIAVAAGLAMTYAMVYAGLALVGRLFLRFDVGRDLR